MNEGQGDCTHIVLGWNWPHFTVLGWGWQCQIEQSRDAVSHSVKRKNPVSPHHKENFFLSFLFSFYCISEKMDFSCTCFGNHFTLHINQAIILHGLNFYSDKFLNYIKSIISQWSCKKKSHLRISIVCSIVAFQHSWFAADWGTEAQFLQEAPGLVSQPTS